VNTGPLAGTLGFVPPFGLPCVGAMEGGGLGGVAVGTGVPPVAPAKAIPTILDAPASETSTRPTAYVRRRKLTLSSADGVS
jgi:hypothetical protein